MRPAAALTASALAACLALAGSAAADPDPTDLSPYLVPIQDTFLGAVESSVVVVSNGAAMFQERFDQFRIITEGAVDEIGSDVNACPMGSALPPLRVPASTGEVSPDPAALVATADGWADDLSVPLNAEADCRWVQAEDVGAPAYDPPEVPTLPALPDFPQAPGAPNVPDVPALPPL